MLIKLFDFHCDTLSKFAKYDTDTNQYEFADSSCFDEYTQVFAVYVSSKDETPENSAFEQLKIFERIKIGFERIGGRRALLSVENATAFGDNYRNIDAFIYKGLKILSLTHNGDNQYACGAMTKSDTGLTEKGKELISYAEKNSVAIDVSHLSFNSIYDVLKIAKNPVCATHSNAYSVCSNRRNITDDMFKEIVDMGGIVGINMYPHFLGKCADSNDVLKHIMHFLNLGGEKNIAFGCDFDGINETPFDIKTVSDLLIIYKKLENLKIDLKTIDDIYYNNANNYINKFPFGRNR